MECVGLEGAFEGQRAGLSDKPALTLSFTDGRASSRLNTAVVRKTQEKRTTRNVLIQTNHHNKLKWNGSRTSSGGKYNVWGEKKKYKLSRESLERLSFIQKPPCVFHSNSLHFPFNFLSLCLSLSLLSPHGSHAELLLRERDCRLASRLISLFIPLSHSWLTNTKRGRRASSF